MIELTRHDGVGVLTLRHGKANLFDLEVCEEIGRRLEEIETSGAAAAVLAAEGSIFSAGVDLKRLLAEGADYPRRFLPALSAMLERLFFFPRPVVAAVNGHAVAGGCILACAADRRLMAKGSGRIGVPELRVGVPFPAMAFEALRFAAPPEQLQALVYVGATYEPEEALARGLVDEVVAPEALSERALAAARELAAVPAAAFAHTKRQVRQPVRDRLARHAEAWDRAAVELWSGEATRRVVAEYLERTLRR